MRILHITGGVGLSSFGVAPVVMGLAKEQLKLGHATQIWHVDNAANEEWAIKYSQLPKECFRRFERNRPDIIGWSREMESAAIGSDGGEFDILHHHGMWMGFARASAKWVNVHKKPLIVAPHGMLEPWRLKQSAWKKRLAYILYDRSNLRNAACFHACSEMESQSIRSFGLKKTIALIPNAVDDEILSIPGNAAVFRDRLGIPKSSRVLLFLSRLHPLKGIPILIASLSNISSDWYLIVAGGGIPKYVESLQSYASDVGISEKVKFVGLLQGQEKRDAFAAADVFVLPSYSENFGIAVAEALGCGVPVITTTGTPWQELETHICGWWVEPNKESIESAVIKALAMPEPELKSMGANGRLLIESKYTWKTCGRTCVETYNWLLQGGKCPDCVRLADE